MRAGVAYVKAVEVNGLAYSYPDGTPALHDVSLAVDEGECVGLVGPNGAGKSTLLLHLNGTLPETPPADSCIRIFGLPATRPNLVRIRRDVGPLFQDPDDQLFCPTVREDVAFGPEQFGRSAGEIDERVRSALAHAGLSGYENRAPHHLSQGEKRRVCLAGVLACEPRMLLLDEPTSDLDPRGRREFKALLAGLPAARILASHDLDLVADLCSRVLVLDGGRIVADGPSAEVLGDRDLMMAHGLEVPWRWRHPSR